MQLLQESRDASELLPTKKSGALWQMSISPTPPLRRMWRLCQVVSLLLCSEARLSIEYNF